MRARVEAAIAACAKLIELLSWPVATPMSQAVWTLLHKAVARSRDYDLRLQFDDVARQCH